MSYVNLAFPVVFMCLTRACLSGYVAVSSNDIYQTGPKAFTIKASGNNNNKFFVNCNSNRPANLSLSFGDEVIVKVIDDHVVTYDFPRKSSSQGNYSCSIDTASQTLNGSNLFLRIETTVEIFIITSSTNAFCTSSVGKYGFRGEYAYFLCLGSSAKWMGWDARSVGGRFKETELEQYSCGKQGGGNEWTESCKASDLTLGLASTLQIVISPTTFPGTHSVLEFVCESWPPRLVYWEVFGNNGNILDESYLGDYLEVDTEIVMSENRIGISTLRISESVPGGNGIHTVVCFSYDTVKTVSIARIAETPTVTPSIASTPGQAQDNGSSSSSVDIRDVTMFIVAIIVLVVIVVVLGSVSIFRYVGTKRVSSPTSKVPRTVENPAYAVHHDNSIGTIIRSRPEYMEVLE